MGMVEGIHGSCHQGQADVLEQESELPNHRATGQ